MKGWFAILLVLAQPALASQLPEVASGRIERLADFPSRYVPPRNVDVWLPDGYPGAGKYDVLYMHDGQMLFDPANTWNHQEWRAEEVASTLIASGKTRPFIIVGIWNAGAARHSEYFPQKPFESLPKREREALYAVGREQGQPMFATEVSSDRYLEFLVRELKPHIDRHFAVQRSRDHTFILGSSMGGLISLYALTEYPDVFGGAACMSTHWPGTMSGKEADVPAAFLAYLRHSLPRPDGHRIYFDHGTATLDAMYPELQKQVDAVMRSKGYDARSWQTRVFEGAEHSERSWSERLDVPLEFLLAPGER